MNQFLRETSIESLDDNRVAASWSVTDMPPIYANIRKYTLKKSICHSQQSDGNISKKNEVLCIIR